jgi:hypothetical protein
MRIQEIITRLEQTLLRNVPTSLNERSLRLVKQAIRLQLLKKLQKTRHGKIQAGYKKD